MLPVRLLGEVGIIMALFSDVAVGFDEDPPPLRLIDKFTHKILSHPNGRSEIVLGGILLVIKLLGLGGRETLAELAVISEPLRLVVLLGNITLGEILTIPLLLVAETAETGATLLKNKLELLENTPDRLEPL